MTRLIEDESFQQWVLKSDSSAQAYWDEWIAQHPEHRDEVEIASEMIRGIRFSRKVLLPAEIDSAWRDLQQKMSNQNPHRSFRLWAASLAGLIIFAATFWLWSTSQPKEIAYETPFGKTGFWQLPDGSKLTLNAHSKVTYKMHEQPYPVREISLTGEAYFEVVHLGDNKAIPFVVKTPDLTIEVLGTEFNVSTRRGRTRVVLDAGRVKLQLPTKATATTMNPGELIEYTPLENEIRKEHVDTEIFTSWRRKSFKI